MVESMRKHSWQICPMCHEKFTAKNDRSLLKTIEAHLIQTDISLGCMSQAQLKLSFRRNDEFKAWEMK